MLAVGPARRVAFEAQLAAMTTDVGQQRTDRYATDGIDTVWVTVRDAPWLYTLPGVKVAEDDDGGSAGDGHAPVVMRRGCAQAHAPDSWTVR